MKMIKIKRTFYLFIFIILISGCSSTELLDDGHEATSEHLEEHEHEEKFHIHTDFKVYINDEQIDFSVPMYQLRAKSVHLEDGIGDVVHIHEKGITMGDFLETLGITFNDSCFVSGYLGDYCNQGDKTLKFYVNGEKNYQYADYEIKNLDKYLITFGNDSEGDIQKQLNSISDNAKNHGD